MPESTCLANEVRAAIANPSLCTSQTVSALQSLLSTAPKKIDAFHEAQSKPIKGRKPPVKEPRPAANRSAKATGAKPKTARGTTLVSVHTGDHETLAPGERYKLALEVVNSTLKALTVNPKPQSKATLKGSRAKVDHPTTKHAHKTSSSRDSSSPCQNSEKSPRSPLVELHNSSSPARRTSTHSSAITPGPSPAITAVAECSRLAFSYLRSNQSRDQDIKPLPALQIESGMLALAGKLILHGLDTLAIRELRMSKKRLERHGCVAEPKATSKEEAQALEKETLATLLHVECKSPSSALLALIVLHQTNVLKLISNSKRVAFIESLPDYLDASSPLSPTAVILECANLSDDNTKATKQLESLAKSIASLCSITDASMDAKPKSCISPQTALRLQTIALGVHKQWWQLAGHSPDMEKELFQPLSRYLETYREQSTHNAKEKYSYACSNVSSLIHLKPPISTAATNGNSAFSVYRSLSMLAHSAGMPVEALQLTEIMGQACAGKGRSGALHASFAIRSLALHVDTEAEPMKIQDKLRQSEVVSEQLDLDNTAHTAILLTELAGLRKLVVVLLTQNKVIRAVDPIGSKRGILCETAIFCAKLFQKMVRDQVGTRSIDGAVVKLLSPFIGSAVLACNTLISSQSQAYEVVFQGLESCISLAEIAEGKTDSGSPFVSISNAYWLYYQIMTSRGQVPCDEALQCLRRSIETLQNRSISEQEAGFFAIKLEKLGSLTAPFEEPLNAYESMNTAAKAQITSGILKRLAQSLDRLPLQASLDCEANSQSVVRLLSVLHKAALQRDDYKGFYDDEELSVGERAVLLEMQASLLEQIFADPSRHHKGRLHFCSLMNYLMELYNGNDYPLRKARVCTRVLIMAKQHPGLFEPDLIRQSLDYHPKSQSDTCDHGLERFETYLTSSLKMAQICYDDSPPRSEMLLTLQMWESLIDGCASWRCLEERVEHMDTFILQLRALAAFLALRGDTEKYAEALQLLASIYQLQPTCDSSLMLDLLAELSLQYLQMGHSGIAATMLDRADLYGKHDDLSPRARVQHCLAQVEINLTLDRLDRAQKWSSTLEGILRSVKMSDPALKSGLQQMQADAALVYSLISARFGDHENALIQAHRSVRLNRHALSTPRYELPSLTSPSDSAVDLDNVIEGMNKLEVSDHTLEASNGQHQSASSPAFWDVVPSVLRGLIHLAHLYGQIGLISDAMYYAQEANRLAGIVDSAEGRTRFAAFQALHTVTSYGRTTPGLDTAENLNHHKLSLGFIELHTARGDICARSGAWEDASDAYDAAEAVAIQVANKTFNDRIRFLQRDQIKSSIAKEAKPVTGTRPNASRAGQGTRTTRLVSKIAPSKKPTSKATNPPPTKSPIDGTLPVSELRATILRQKSLLLIRQGQSAAATALLEKAESMYARAAQSALQQTVYVRAMVSRFAHDASTDFTFNVLPESTISFPAISLKPRQKSCTEGNSSLLLTPPRHIAPTSPMRGGRKKQDSDHFGLMLHNAQSQITNVQSNNVQRVPLATCYQICSLVCETTVLLSAIDTGLSRGMLHPTRAALSIEMPRIEASCREISALQLRKSNDINQGFGKLGLGLSNAHTASMSAVHFQQDFIDILPEPWTALSLGLSEDCRELYVTRYRSREAPFILRLPMVRNKFNDLDEDPAEDFGFEAGRAELQDIVTLSNYSCHRAPSPSVSGAKTLWWAEREALDERMHELLINIENIWLGGFKSVLSQHQRQPDLLARFRKTFESILDRHLPSRQGAKGRSKKLTLDANVLELFIGLGDDQDGAIDIDEQILDLLYFVVDILQFNGERNAYDEVDFDSIATETLDALRSYHEVAQPPNAADQHLILILDKRLHGFPWENLPCLQGNSVSRVGSMLALRERIVAMRRKQCEKSKDTFATTRLSGTYIMNPSSDLVNTEAMLEPLLNSLQGRDQSKWGGMTNKIPTQQYFTNALSESSVLLYFGHGSGNQYIPERVIKKLKQCSEVVWLIGCSSGTVTENGDFEPTSVPLSYLMAGEQHERPADYESKGTSLDIVEHGRKGLCMAVLATLWDVTDKDIDQFSVRVGEEWGLWSSDAQANASRPGQSVAKTPAKRGRGAPKTPAKTLGRSRSRATNVGDAQGRKKSIVEAVAKARDVCHLRYLNGAATVVYGIPMYLGD